MTSTETRVLHVHCDQCDWKVDRNIYTFTAYVLGGKHMEATGHEVTVR